MTAHYFDALDPERSAIVEACAGSGKTWMLVSRILRLLLAGVPPGDILAITFTRLAAREMESRLMTWLKALALDSDEQVVTFLMDRGLSPVEARALLPRARGLYEAYLQASPTVTLCTFDVWFLRLLRHAPLAGPLRRDSVPGTDTRKLRQEVWQSLLRQAEGARQQPLAVSLDWLFREAGLFNTRTWVESFANWRAEWWAFTEGQPDPVRHAGQALESALGIHADFDAGRSLQEDSACRQALETLADALERGSPGVRSHSAILRAVMTSQDPVLALMAALHTSAGEVRKRIQESARAAGPAAQEAHGWLLERARQAWGQWQDQKSLCANRHLFQVGQCYLDLLVQLQQRQGESAFQDVQWAVCRMLESSEQSEYLQYRLDARYRHLLLDEFQDTSPLQWRTLSVWLRSARAADHAPSVFLVGDPNQSIYRFRRADPRLFEQVARHLEDEWKAIRVRLDRSQRNGPAVVGLVNRVFEASAGFHPLLPQRRSPAPDAVEVLVLAWEEPANTAPATEGAWRDPLRAPRQRPETSREAAEARVFVDRISAWKNEGQIRFQDILVLAQRRAQLEPYAHALRAAHIPYLTRRRGELLETLEIHDMRQLLRFLLRPQDNLALAQVLRSPLFAVADIDLLPLAGAPSWWQALQEMPASSRLGQVAGPLARWRSWALRLPVHDLLDRIWGDARLVEKYRQAVPVALQGAVQANLHAFLELALNLEGGRYPSLPRFLQVLEDLEQEDEEAPDEGGLGTEGNAVRLMTIHAAKGLEAPVVWLVEPRDLSRAREGAQWFVEWPPMQERPRHFSLVPSRGARGPGRSGLLEEEERLLARERDNLLYVALTRAQQRLVVTGRAGAEASAWFQRIAQAAAGTTVLHVTGPPCNTASAPTTSG